ncbi:MAG: hypothetical protein AAGL11_05590, partial [Pseudomonadota bacterium]
MSCEISVIYPGLDGEEIILEIPETRRAFGVIGFGSDPTVCFGSAPGMGGFVLDRWEAEEYGILPRHCALLWAGGKFRLEFDRHAGVYLNGSETCARSFCNPFEDGPEFEMRLGLPSSDSAGDDLGIAPVFRVRRTDRARRKSSWWSDLAMRASWFRKVAMVPFLVSLPALVMFVAALASVVIGVNIWQNQRITEALIRGDISQEMGAELAQSVASVGIACDDEFAPLGTAWLYEHRQDGVADPTKWLVTNLHVVRQINDQSCSEGASTRKVLAKFPQRPGVKTNALNVELNTAPRKHPLHDPFEQTRSTSRASPSGQQAVANVYDLAAYPLDTAALASLQNERRFLTLSAPSPGQVSSYSIETLFTQNVEPGRPVLILSYPTENQPFLYDGVSSEPFQFRTALQSKSNAMSRSIPGVSSNRTPALYSFSAKSAGGMSGSPVIAVDQDDEPFIAGIVFAASFVRGPTDAADGAPSRLASGDGTYALDATSLSSISDWPLETEPVPSESLQAVQLVWQSWADRTNPMDERRQQFADLNQKIIAKKDNGISDLRLCSASKEVALNRRLKVDDQARGESGRAIKFQFEDSAQNTLLVAETQGARGNDALLQLAISTRRNGRKQTSHAIGLDQATFVKPGTAPLEVDITVAGPFKSSVVLTAYEAVADGE